ncbi:MAG: MBL fold metallo-hydrolase [Myxococcota bacterium]
MLKTPFEHAGYLIDQRTVGPFQTNSFLMLCTQTREAVLIDSCAEFTVLKAMIETHDAEIVALLQTHAHLDHVGALAEMQDWTDAPIFLHPHEQPLYEALPMQCELFGLPKMPTPPPYDHPLHEGEEITFGHCTLRVLETPGHTPGGVTFVTERLALVGDTLFASSIGRSDLPGGDASVLMQSLQRLMELDDDTVVCAGHGPLTTIGQERTHNPFLIA